MRGRRLQGMACLVPSWPSMRKANLSEIAEEKSGSPSGKFCTIDKPLNAAIGGDSRSMDLRQTMAFRRGTNSRIPGRCSQLSPPQPCKSCTSMYIILSGNATLRDKDGETESQGGRLLQVWPSRTNRTRSSIAAHERCDLLLRRGQSAERSHAYYPDSDEVGRARIPEKRDHQGRTR